MDGESLAMFFSTRCCECGNGDLYPDPNLSVPRPALSVMVPEAGCGRGGAGRRWEE